MGGRVETDPVFATSTRGRALPRSQDGEYAGKRVEAAFLRDDGAIGGAPPVSLEESGHHAVATSAVPHERAARSKNPREFGDRSLVVGGIHEEPERREEIDHGVEPTRPPRRQAPHVAAGVSEAATRSACARTRQQYGRVVEAVHVEAGFREQMRVTSLPAWHVEHPCVRGQLQQRYEARHLAPIAREVEQGLVLEEVLIVEVRPPPLGGA